METELSHLADPDIVVFEQRQYDLDPYSPVAAWVAAYTTIVLTDEQGTTIRREIAAGIDVLAAMTIPARLVVCALRNDTKGHGEIVDLVRRLGPVSVRVAICGGIEALVKSRLADESLVNLLGEPPRTPVRAALVDPFDLTGDGAAMFLAGVLAGIDDPCAAVLEIAELLAQFLCSSYEPTAAAAAADAYTTSWTTNRYVDDHGNRTAAP